MNLDKIYKLDVGGTTRVWWAEAHGGYWRTHSGTLHGEIVTSEWKFAEARSQATSEAQALFYANAATKKKLKGGDYHTSINEITTVRNSYIRPMKAHIYDGWIGPCYAQPKLDGMRCLANETGLWTQKNRQIISAPHIEDALQEFFSEYPYIILDGELYNHDLKHNFNRIMSVARKTTGRFEDLQESKEHIQYWIFDMFDMESPHIIFQNRWKFLQEELFARFQPEQVVATPTDFMRTEEELDIYYIELLKAGFEGQIVRHNTLYEQKRTSALLKRKDFQDEEFELLDIEEGQGSWQGIAKIARCCMPNGREFSAGIDGTQEDNTKLLHEKDRYRSVTVKYHALTPDGVPRFPIAIKFHEEMFTELEERTTTIKRDLFG